MTPAAAIIPAEPGWLVLNIDEGTGELFSDGPVIAWEVQRCPLAPRHRDRLEPDHFLFVQAVTINGRDDCNILLRPDGVVEDRDVQEWPSMEVANAPEECRKRIPKRATK